MVESKKEGNSRHTNLISSGASPFLKLAPYKFIARNKLGRLSVLNDAMELTGDFNAFRRSETPEIILGRYLFRAVSFVLNFPVLSAWTIVGNSFIEDEKVMSIIKNGTREATAI
jgi:hypothetical protein